MVMACGTAGREPHPDFYGGVGTVNGVAKNPFLRDAATFASGHVTTIEPGGNTLFTVWLGQEISCELPESEGVKW